MSFLLNLKLQKRGRIKTLYLDFYAPDISLLWLKGEADQVVIKHNEKFFFFPFSVRQPITVRKISLFTLWYNNITKTKGQLEHYWNGRDEIMT